MRRLKRNDLVGKAIVDIDLESLNYLNLVFDDETELQIWCESGEFNDTGSWGFFVDDESDDGEEEETD